MTLVKGVDLYHRVMQEFFLRSVFPLMHLLILVWGDSFSSFSLFTKVIENKHAKATHNDISRITNPPPPFASPANKCYYLLECYPKHLPQSPFVKTIYIRQGLKF